MQHLDATFWVGIAFVVFVGALFYYKVHGMLVGALDERAARIRAELEEAQRLREEAQALLSTYERKQREAMGEVEAIHRHAREEAARQARIAADKLDEQLKRREQLSLEKIALAEAQAEQQVREAAVDAAIAAAARVIAERLDEAAASRLVDDTIRDLRRHLN
jgi:F-type H+-transporting ATPase subunit b